MFNNKQIKKTVQISGLGQLILMVMLTIFSRNLEARDHSIDYREKIYITTDRELYITGEKVWFQSFIIPVHQNLLSKIVYVELYDASRAFLQQYKYKINQMSAAGYIKLPDNMESGGYMLRAYTRYSRNFPAVLYAYKALSVINPESGVNRPPEKNDKTNDDIFVNNGLAVYMSNNSMDDIGFKKEETGYKVSLQLQQSDSLEPETLRYKLINPDLSLVDSGFFHSRNGKHTLFLGNKGIQPGINYIIMAGKKGSVKGWACFYHHNSGYRSLSIQPDKKTYKCRERAKISVCTQDKPKTGSAVSPSSTSSYTATFTNIPKTGSAVSHDQYTVPMNQKITPSMAFKQLYFNVSVNRKNMNAGLEDTSYIYQLIKAVPNTLNNLGFHYPFINQIPVRHLNEALSNHLTSMTEDDKFKAFMHHHIKLNHYPEIWDASLTGVLTGKDQENISGKQVFLSILGKNPQLHVNKTDENGKFRFFIHHQTGETKIFVGADSKHQEQEIHIDNDFSVDWNEGAKIPLFVDANDTALLEKAIFASQVQKKFNTSIQTVSVAPGQVPPIQRYGKRTVMANYIELPTTKEILNELVMNVHVKEEKGQDQIWVTNANTGELYKDPLVLVDNMPVFDASKVLELPSNAVQTVTLINRPYYIGDFSFKGMVFIETNTGDFGGLVPDAGSAFLNYQTIKPHSRMIQTQQRLRSLPYYRNLVYWSTGKRLKKNHAFEMMMPDEGGQYEIIIRGYDSGGNHYYGYETITVE